MSDRGSSTYGFAHTSKVLKSQIRQASESRGFSETKVLTHWREIVGDEMAAIARPVKVAFGRQGLGATLTILTTGSHAPMLEMQKESLRDKVNAVYGYNAIARIHITQTAPTGFADGKPSFDYGKKAKAPEPAPDAKVQRAATELAQNVTDPQLREALEDLGQNVLTHTKR